MRLLYIQSSNIFLSFLDILVNKHINIYVRHAFVPFIIELIKLEELISLNKIIKKISNLFVKLLIQYSH